jgi:F0F1-type ATP synthase assembly protein I
VLTFFRKYLIISKLFKFRLRNNKSVDNSSKAKDSKEKQQTWTALSLAWQLGYSIAVPIVALAFTGRLLDRKFNTSPWLLLTGIFLSLIISTFAVYLKTIKILSQAEPEGKKEDVNKQP